MISRVLPVLPLLLFVLCQQQTLIDRVPGYTNLPACAASPLSAIVGNMASGCNSDDGGGRGTSRSCFCAASSTAFDAAISAAVASKCGGGAEATAGAAQASAVFGEYCRGINAPRTTTAVTTSAGRTNATGTLSCGWTPMETQITVYSAASGPFVGLRERVALSSAYLLVALSSAVVLL